MPAKDILKAAVAAVGEKIRNLRNIHASFILGGVNYCKQMPKRGKPTPSN
jgi:hypothetical protein